MDRRLTRMSAARVLVVGDLILDRYWHGSTSRISPEAPVPVVRVNDLEERAGGAANVAANAAALGAVTILVGVVGEDDEGARLLDLCRESGIEPDVARRPGEATTVKLRVISQHQQLIRLDFEQDAKTDGSAVVVERAEARMPDCDVVVVSDYAKGSVTRVPDIIAAADRIGRPVIVDPKGTDFTRYSGADLVTPNLRELEAVTGPCRDDAELVKHAGGLCRELDIGAILVTRGDAGMSLVPRDGPVLHLRAQARDVFDVTGAGDTVCAITAVALAAGNSLADAVTVANAAAGLVVGKLGTASVSLAELDSALARPGTARRGIMDRVALLDAVARARQDGARVVMTNGCFDIVHAGHVRYLTEAASLADRLVVAVNDDASVTALKGPMRPVHSLDARMQVLAALDMVDWVVPFSGATPQALIAEVLPDLLVKGGDYDTADIAGASEVIAAGGRVMTLEYHDGYSTSHVLERRPAGDGSIT